MSARSFTEGEVDYLVSLPKFIRNIPKVEFLDRANRKGWKIHARVYRTSDGKRPIDGLVVIAKAHQAPPGLPHPTPSTALEWHGKRIRGLNYELWHDNPDGTRIRGWHEHLWSPEDEDHRVIAARPEPTRKQLREILQWGLEKWNIEVREEQEVLGYDN